MTGPALPPKARVLVVEDESIVASDISLSLESLGYEVLGVAISGQAALDRVAEERPDVVLMDIVLQGPMDGVQAAEKVRSRYGVPVIYLTAFTDETVLERAKVTEPFGYLIKPFEERELHFTIQMALYKHRMEAERQALTRKLEDALASVKTLRGLLPICAWCKRIRDDKGYWKQVEAYVQEHSEAEFTHGMCPDCRDQMEHDLDDHTSKRSRGADET